MPDIVKTGPSALTKVESVIKPMPNALLLLCISMYLNYMFFITRVTKFFILKKLNKSMELLNSASLIDTTMFVLGMLSYFWSWDLRAVLLHLIENGLS